MFGRDFKYLDRTAGKHSKEFNMATATLESFKEELTRLVDKFGQGERTFKHKDYLEDRVRTDFLDPFIRALGWDRDNTKNQIESVRDVESESGVRISGNKKRADYLFRTNGNSHFICEAKKPIEELDPHAWQAKRYAWNLGLAIATLSDFEDFHIYVVGSRPEENESAVGQYKIWNYKKYVECAEELWNLFSYENVKSGSLERLVESLPKKASGKNKGGYAIKPDRTKTVDKVFLEDLEKSRLELGKNIFKNNGRKDVFEHNRLNENTQRILDRILFLRICEARGIDTGQTLESLSDTIRHPKDGTSAYAELAKYFQKLGKPTSGVPYFNGNIFSKHSSEDLTIGNDWLLDFIDGLSAEKSPYLFEVMPIEILGLIYEQFLGKQLVAKGSGVAVDEKPAVKKAGGVYYIPRYIVDYIVEQTLGKQLSEIANGNGQQPSLKDFDKQTSALKVLDPACGSGSFLIRAFERICEHWERRLKDDLPFKDAPNRAAWEKEHRTHCYIDPQRDAVFLTVGLKRKILLDNIYGVDIDPAAVEVTQLSLYLKMLEHETKTTLGKQKDLFPSDIAVLPALKDNIKCGNSLISSDFSDLPEDLTRVHAFDWSVQFEAIIKDGGFDTVIGNPPYLNAIENRTSFEHVQMEYIKMNFSSACGAFDASVIFQELGLRLLKVNGLTSMIVPNKFLSLPFGKAFRKLVSTNYSLLLLADFSKADVFKGVATYPIIYVIQKIKCKLSLIEIEVFLKSAPHPLLASSSRIQVDLDLVDTWYLLFSRGLQLLDKLRQQFLSIDKFYEVVASATVDEAYRYKKFISDTAPPSRAFLFVTSGSIDRYGHTHGQFKIRYLKQDYASPKLPKNCQELTPNRLRQYSSDKIIVAGMTKTIEAILASGEIAGSIATVQILNNMESPCSLKCVLGIINSCFLNWVYTQYFGALTLAGGYLKIGAPQISSLPFFQNESNSKKNKVLIAGIEKSVDKMLDLTPKIQAAKSEADKATLQNAITATDNEIDRLVYDLYGLTEDEIKLVEESSANNK